MRLYNRLKARQGWFLYRLGDYQQAEDLVAACVRTARAVQAEDEVAFGLDILGPLAYHRGDYSMAAQYMETSRKLRRRLGDTWGESVALNNLGAVTFTLGNIEKARQLHEECLALKLPTGDPWLLAYTYNHLGRVAFAQERYEDARMHFQECINQATRIDYRLLIAGTHQNIGRIHLGTGQPEAARDSLQRAAAILESIGDGCGTAQALGYLGEAHYQLNHLAAAQHVLQRGLRLARICDSPPLILDIITRLAIINGDTGPADAVEILTMVTMQTHTPQHTLELAQSLLEGLRDQLSEPDFQAAADRGRRGSTSAAVDRLTA
ncbi:MAG: tetratricopeptide repeat protein [Anaerolineae bacterium]